VSSPAAAIELLRGRALLREDLSGLMPFTAPAAGDSALRFALAGTVEAELRR
jgi:hypothetical protein